VAETRTLGLRVQIVLSLAGLMMLAFVPLFFAVASLTRATLRGVREQDARTLGRAVAAHVGDARRAHDRRGLERILESSVGGDGVYAIGVFGGKGELEASAGDAVEIAAMHPAPPYGERAETVRGTSGRVLEVVVPNDDAAVVARLKTDDSTDHAAPLVRLVALYMATFGIALLTFAYFALTRLIVRPVDALARATSRVAEGARSLTVPQAGARELSELAVSVQTMATRLIDEEAAMRRKVEELTATTTRLTETQRQLVRSERLASVGRLAAGLAHEIGNPIAALLGMEEILIDGGLDAATERINNVVRDLLDFARPEAKTIAPMLAPADVREVLEDVTALVKPQKGFKSITVAIVAPRDGMRVALAGPKLTQVLLNMVLNAGAAMGDREGTITLRAAREAEGVRIEVEDSGPGVPVGMEEEIFEPFFTTKDVGDGTGLGLSVCRGIVESAKGTIAVDRAYREGARFVVSLPSGDS
jgi:two-component system NtrC family sensor kinase